MTPENEMKQAKSGKKKSKGKKTNKKKHKSLSACVTHAVEQYFVHLDQENTSGFYDLVLREVEAPLLTVVMQQTDNNQSAAAELLGLSRGTLRKKLKEYGLL